jgi:hypothetical protein
MPRPVEGRRLQGVVVVSGGGLSTGAIVGIALGSFFVLTLIPVFLKLYPHIVRERERRRVIAAENAKVEQERKRRVTECVRDDPKTWPFKVISRKTSLSGDVITVCWYHGLQVCTKCCTDFGLLNILRHSSEYRELLETAGEEKRLSLVASHATKFYERVKDIRLVNETPSPFMSTLEEHHDLSQRGGVETVTLASYHCYQARWSPKNRSHLVEEIDDAVRAMLVMHDEVIPDGDGKPRSDADATQEVARSSF